MQHLPSCSSVLSIRFLFFLGVFINNGNIVRSPKISTNLLQLSLPCGPDNAWFNTFNEPFLLNFFSLKQCIVRILSFELKLKTQI